MNTTQERRRYIRISTVFPVAFYLMDKEGTRITPWLQGFTNNIARGGICLVVNDLWWGYWNRFKIGASLFLTIDLPFKKKIITTKASVVWRQKERVGEFIQCVFGLEFTEIDARERARFFRYAVWKKSIPYLSAAVIAVLLCCSFLLWIHQHSLVAENKRLVARYVRLQEKADMIKTSLDEEKELLRLFKEQQKKLDAKLFASQKELDRWQATQQSLPTPEITPDESFNSLKGTISQLKNNIAKLDKENETLKAQLKKKEASTVKLTKMYVQVEEEKNAYVSKIIEGMYEWITTRQDLSTGLVLSYEGDDNLARVAFTYDQALASIVYTLHGDFEKAQAILNFYHTQVSHNTPIYNAYYTDGSVFEYTRHSGVNAWIGLAALNYVKMTHQRQYLDIAKSVARFLEEMMDEEGGIRGGPQIPWYSTEHNLDSYAFFKMLYELTPQSSYQQAYTRIQQWIDRYSYTDKGPPVSRGKGDSTIATDTYSWSITALGPKELLSLKMDPEEIMDFAIKHCEVKTTFSYQDRTREVIGFDFAKAKNIARGGVISCEWTAQMILAFQILADYYTPRDDEKAKLYFDRAKYYFEELQKMVINSPSPVGKALPTLPYASQSLVDTGHGWRTPQGDRVGSLASTAYFLISYFGFNPLQVDRLTMSLKDVYEPRTDHSYSKVN